jgi:hypothetical protein
MADSQKIEVTSIYRHAKAVAKEDGSIIFQVPERIGYEDDEDISLHIVQEGERLWDIAQSHFGQSRHNPWDIWDLLSQFQPEPILDASTILKTGMEIFIPSDDFVEEALSGVSMIDTPEI